jgi:O-methyltransferase
MPPQTKLEAMIKSAAHKSFRAVGLDIVRFQDPATACPADIPEDDAAIIQSVRSWTMTSPERLYAFMEAARYISTHGVPGAIVECGVWKGGSMAAAAKALLRAGDRERELYLFDTFEGMSPPTSKDVDYSGKAAAELLSEDPRFLCDGAPLDEVKAVLRATGYPAEKVHFVQGMVEQTIPAAAPETIAILRLDTDWYESTKHELVHLFPRLSENGVIIIDDYGHWQGARQACDEYFAENRVPILLNRIDFTGRIAVKR